MTLSAQYARFIGALNENEFFGRTEALDAIGAVGDGLGRRLGLLGGAGAGKSELLRRGAVRMAGRKDALPLYLNLNAVMGTVQHGGEAAGWRRLTCAAIAQALVLRGARVEPGVPAEALAALCRDCGLDRLAALAAAPEGGGSEDRWRALPGALEDSGLPGAALFVDGAAESDNVFWLRRILGSAGSTPVAFETPGPGFVSPQGTRMFALEPLDGAEADNLAVGLGERLGWSLPAAARGPALYRLGPWPGWVRAFARQICAQPSGLSPVRCAEQGYLDFLTESDWAHDFAARFERRIPLAWRERTLNLVQSLIVEKAPVPASRALAMLGEPDQIAEDVLTELEGLGLARRAGDAFEAPREAALRHWTQLRSEASRGECALARRRTVLFSSLLTAARDRHAAPSEPRVETMLEGVLDAFDGQSVPEVLFQYGHYYEALGRLEPGDRREAVQHSTASHTLPEVVDFVRWDSAEPPLYHALGYRGGKYQRSHEQRWMIADLSGPASLTSPEIERVLNRIETVKRALGPGDYIAWLLVGAEVSPEALKLLNGGGLFSSNLEQLSFLNERVMPRPPRRPPGETKTALDEVRARLQRLRATVAFARGGETPAPVAPAPPRGAVIEAVEAAKLPGREVNRLSLPARSDSELIAALTVEKIAIHAGFDSAEAGRIKTAVLEGVLNAIEHSPNDEKTIQLSVELHEDRIEILIENEGGDFDPHAVESPDPKLKLHSDNKRGWGIKLMQRFMDEVGYEPCEGGTRLRIVKLRPGPEPGGYVAKAEGGY